MNIYLTKHGNKVISIYTLKYSHLKTLKLCPETTSEDFGIYGENVDGTVEVLDFTLRAA